MEKANYETVLEFQKNKEGITVFAKSISVLEAVIGMAETIQLIMEETRS